MLAAASIKHVARVTSAPLDNTLLKVIVPALIASSKEKNTAVKASAESALMYVLRLRDGEATLQVTIANYNTVRPRYNAGTLGIKESDRIKTFSTRAHYEDM